MQCFRNWIVLGLMLLGRQFGTRRGEGTAFLLKLLLLALLLKLL